MFIYYKLAMLSNICMLEKNIKVTKCKFMGLFALYFIINNYIHTRLFKLKENKFLPNPENYLF